MSYVVHAPSLQTNVEGIGRQRIAIVGYSHHYGDGDTDSKGFTKGVIRRVISGEKRPHFFSKIQEYFGHENDGDFWNRVTFFNYLPCCIGPSKDKYDVGTSEKLKIARARMSRILSDQKPRKVFVFTKKGWNDFRWNLAGDLISTPLISGLAEPSWVTYRADGHKILVCGLRHPQYANRTVLKAQVQAFLATR